MPAGIVAGNGRIEARQIDIAALHAGRVREVLVTEGDLVNAGAVLARVDTDELEAALDGATAAVALEREKLVFRVRVRMPPDLVAPHIQHVRTGLRGVVYIQLSPSVAWPEPLQTEGVRVTAVSHRYGKVRALDGVTLEVPAGCFAGVIGPDGVGKSALLGLIAGARRIQSGSVRALGGDMAGAAHRRRACGRIAYMPHGLGRNAYAELSVAENLDGWNS